ncbi:hypothetical protein GJAV_G00232470 [Gymnothorax javanicus]|nr:hypothetical protein GJAV_G00232470 [Gymnothorax javanicus]
MDTLQAPLFTNTFLLKVPSPIAELGFLTHSSPRRGNSYLLRRERHVDFWQKSVRSRIAGFLTSAARTVSSRHTQAALYLH